MCYVETAKTYRGSGKDAPTLVTANDGKLSQGQTELTTLLSVQIVIDSQIEQIRAAQPCPTVAMC